MEIDVVGRGGTLYSTLGKQSASSYLLTVIVRGVIVQILMDAGYGMLARMIAMGIDVMSIDTVFISHLHMDHVADLPYFVHYRHLAAIRDGRVLNTLYVYGPAGIEKAFKASLGLLDDADFDPDIVFIEGPVKTEMIETVEVRHVEGKKSLAFIFNYGSKQLMYTGDINDDPENDRVLAAVAKSPVIITEATESGNSCHRDNLGAARLGLNCGAVKLVLGHTRLGHLEAVAEMCRCSGGRCVMPNDGDTIII
jgi:metal-dependent hydrolase (beta-lactamase superfamily II)